MTPHGAVIAIGVVYGLLALALAYRLRTGVFCPFCYRPADRCSCADDAGV